jgi:hypothetical protein
MYTTVILLVFFSAKWYELVHLLQLPSCHIRLAGFFCNVLLTELLTE